MYLLYRGEIKTITTTTTTTTLFQLNSYENNCIRPVNMLTTSLTHHINVSDMLTCNIALQT